MFCERCGKQLDPTLKFCNGCGAQIKKDQDQSKSVLNTMVTALIVIGTGGLGALIGLMAVMLSKLPRYEPAIALGFFYLLAWFGVLFFILRQISKLIDADLFDRKSRTIEAPQFVQLPPRSTNPLEDFRQPASVTDHTTGTLNKIPVQRS